MVSGLSLTVVVFSVALWLVSAVVSGGFVVVSGWPLAGFSGGLLVKFYFPTKEATSANGEPTHSPTLVM